MFTAREIALPKTPGEALRLMEEKKTNRALGGGAWMALCALPCHTAVDLSALGLGTIEEVGGALQIGAMVTLRQLETHPLAGQLFGGILCQCVQPIVGVQLRNSATVGGSVYGRFGFSDVWTALLALGASVRFQRAGVLSLEQFAAVPRTEKDLLLWVSVPMNGQLAAIETLRLTATDLPVLTSAVAHSGGGWRVAVGARPPLAALSFGAAAALQAGKPPKEAGLAAAEELAYGGNLRATAGYRRQLAGVLVARAAGKVMKEEAGQ